jgi:A/G-specific adenine glycosylase
VPDPPALPWPALADALTGWFRAHARDLPWRRERSPYRTWLSEVMLQQTRVATAIDYFERFTARFPDVTALAAADIDEVLALWSGLGYYARGRNLHRAARAVVERGGFPTTADGLRELPGIGPYTAAAIASLAWGERAAAVDGNVARVMARVLDLDAPVDGAGRAVVEAAARALVESAADPAAVTEGLMELGALVCPPRSPRCEACPWTELCAGQARAESLPKKKPRAARKRLPLVAVVAWDGDRILLERREERGLFGGLYAPPTRAGETTAVARALERDLDLEVLERGDPSLVRRTLTHRDLEVHAYPLRVRADARFRPGAELVDLGLSTAARAILRAAWPAADRFLAKRP